MNTSVYSTIFILISCFAISLQSTAQQLDVEGHTRLRGKLDLGHQVDTGSVVIGLEAGLNTNFSNNDSINRGPSVTFLGAYSGHQNTTGFYNTATGFRALYANTIGKNNTATGVYALENNQTGVNNTAVGVCALKTNSNGGVNTAVGTSALEFNGTGSANTGVGNRTLWVNTNGYENTATGASALQSNTSGYRNNASGTEALSNNTTGAVNTAAGYQALYSQESGSGNTAMGAQSSWSDSIGSNNASFGYQALYFNKTGSQNTALGSNAYFTGNNLSNTTCIGYNAGRMSNASNRIEIGNSSVSWIGGQVNWSTYSDRRIKNNIQENVPGLAFINRLRPVTYNLNIHHQNTMCHQSRLDDRDWNEKYLIENNLMTGFIAQEVEEASREIEYEFSGVHKASDTVGIYSLRYAEFVVPLVKAVQELAQQNEWLLQRNQFLKHLSTSQAKQIQNIGKELASIKLALQEMGLNQSIATIEP